MSAYGPAFRHHRHVRAVLLSLAIHVLVVVALWPTPRTPAPPVEVARVEVPARDDIVVEVLELDDVRQGGGGGGHAAPTRAARSAVRAAPDAWQQVSIGMEVPGANGSGASGSGSGRGIGIGTGNGVRVPDDVPAPPPPPSVPEVRVRKARPAKLIHPSRDREVEDEADLFVARVTVDTDGDVVGARMVKTRPGARGDQAANAIWTFRYLPALDDDGRPITSTFDQQFQIR